MRPTRFALLTLAVALVGALTAGGTVVLREPETIQVTAEFTDTTGLYVGNEVSVLGVPVGQVAGIRPQGPTVAVTMDLDEDTPLPSDVGAVIMQSSLVADRYVELTPAYDGGPRLTTGDRIDVRRTRSPANIDDITQAVDDLLVALDETTPGGKDVGDLLEVSADALDGQGRKIRDGLVAAEAALRSVNGNEDHIVAITEDIDALAGALARRDRMIRRFERNVTTSTDLLAEQREELHETLRAIARLSRVVTRFVRDNGHLVRDDLRRAADTLEVVAAHDRELAETFDLMPLMAENISRAFDPRTRRLRIKVDARETGPFSDLFRAQVCRELEPSACRLLLNKDGTGLLDPLLDYPTTLFPESF